MMKKLIIGLVASSAIFVAVPSFAAVSQDQVLAACDAGDCAAIIGEFVNGLSAAERDTQMRLLAAALAERRNSAALNDLRVLANGDLYTEINQLLASLVGAPQLFQTAASAN